MKTSPLLRAWLRRLDASGVTFKLRHRWTGWDEAGALAFVTPDGPVTVAADATVLALGGASWPQLGSSGAWVGCAQRRRRADRAAAARQLRVSRPLVGGLSRPFRRRAPEAARAVVRQPQGTRRGAHHPTGLEGGGIYALTAPLREAIAASGEAMLQIDLLPDVAQAALEGRLSAPRAKQSLSTFLRKAASLSPAAIGLLHEATIATSERLSALAPAALAQLIKAVPVRLTGTAPIARAISTAGGIAFAEIDDEFMLRRLPGVFVAGEMLDWEAPTGGYLLQASFATGAAAGRGVLRWLDRARN